MRLLDLFACGGSAGIGYERAGFDVIGVDIVRHKRNPHPMLIADAMEIPDEIIRMFDGVHGSPMCQGYSHMKNAPGAHGTAPRLILPLREKLDRCGVPYIIENVMGAREEMPDGIHLCGTMFGLGATADRRYDLQRHRLFVSNFPISAPRPCNHVNPCLGVYGGHVRVRAASAGGRKSGDLKGYDRPALAAEAMGVDGLTMDEMSQALPPAYTHHLGLQMRSFIERSRA